MREVLIKDVVRQLEYIVESRTAPVVRRKIIEYVELLEVRQND